MSIFHREALLLVLVSSLSWGATDIDVAVYPFSPFVEKTSDNEWHGVTFDIIDALNAIQSDYHYRPVVTSPYRVYAEMYMGRFDMLLFQDVSWGWDVNKVIISTPLLDYSECYVARYKAGRDQNFFNELNKLTMIGVRGFYYFEKKTSLLLRDDSQIVNALLRERGDFIRLGFYRLQDMLKQDPELRSKLIISIHPAQNYHLRAIFAATSDISIMVFQEHLANLARLGLLDDIWKKYGIQSRVDEDSTLDCNFK
jgi:hypothetical protein